MRDNQQSPPKQRKEKSKDEKEETIFVFILLFFIFGLIIIGTIVYVSVSSEEDHGPEIKLVSMDFAADHYGRDDPLRSARWDLLIRVPGEIVGNYMCLQGYLEASFLYKNITLVTSSIQRYNILQPRMPQVLNVSAVASEKDLSGAIGKEIMEAIKKGNEVRFGSRLSLTDCREEAEKGMMSYECGETTLRFEPSGSDDQIKASAFGKRPTCKISR